MQHFSNSPGIPDRAAPASLNHSRKPRGFGLTNYGDTKAATIPAPMAHIVDERRTVRIQIVDAENGLADEHEFTVDQTELVSLGGGGFVRTGMVDAPLRTIGGAA